MSQQALIIIVDTNVTRAKELAGTCCNHPEIEKALVFDDTIQALITLANDDPVKLILIASDCDPEEVMSLVISAKEMPSSADAVYAIYHEAQQQPQEIFGIDETVALPIDEQVISKLIGSFEAIQEKNQQARMNSSVGLMISTALSEIDRVAKEKKKGRSNANISSHVTEGCKFFQTLAEDQLPSFYSTIFETFDELENILGFSHENQSDANYTEDAPLDDLEKALMDKLSQIK